ncbi:MAG: hypothetical protein DRO23_01100 [Thermoprotei archaeon]|nr:MAG: hypothetical protein DRO23_01100 [Thermoprotei archaeon]
MRARDFKPSRIVAVKKALKGFVHEKLSKDLLARVGIVGFYEYSAPIIDLTNSIKDLLKAIDSLRPLGSGTALGDGIVEAYRMLKDLSRDGVKKRILVITDGTFNTGIDPRYTISSLRLHNVRVDFFAFSRLYPTDIAIIREILRTVKGYFMHIKYGDLSKAIMEFL